MALTHENCARPLLLARPVPSLSWVLLFETEKAADKGNSWYDPHLPEPHDRLMMNMRGQECPSSTKYPQLTIQIVPGSLRNSTLHQYACMLAEVCRTALPVRFAMGATSCRVEGEHLDFLALTDP